MPITRSAVAIIGAATIALAIPFIAPEVAPALSGAPTVASQPTASAPAPASTATPAAPSGSGDTSSGASSQPGSAGGTNASTSLTTTDVTDELARGVVLIDTTTTNGAAAGTGMILTSDGQVLTNYHVVDGSTDIQVTIASTGKTYTATVIGHDAARDVALLQLTGASGLDTVTLDEDTLAVGDALVAVGNANGGGELVAASGAVTALDQSVTVQGEEGTEDLSGVIETDAGAVPGDSGGPMFDAQGEVTGMTTAGGSTAVNAPHGHQAPSTVQVETTAYAVPIDDAMAVVDQIRTGVESGTVQIGANAYLGVSVENGLQVVGVADGSGAADAGITAGSTITAVDGNRVTTQAELADVLSGLNPGDTLKVAWTTSSGKSTSATVTLGSSPIN